MTAKPHHVLSLDLGTRFGWAEIKGGVLIKSGEIKLPGPEGHPGNRFLTFWNWLIKHKHFDEIFYEDVPRFESAKAARVYCGLLAMVQKFCLVYDVTMTNIKSNSVKKEFTGNVNAPKPMMCEVAHRLGWKGGHAATDIDHNECDAIAAAWVILKRRDVDLNFERATR
jgi:Holliday junction resolvasome RuvABC endonuclease subunit